MLNSVNQQPVAIPVFAGEKTGLLEDNSGLLEGNSVVTKEISANVESSLAFTYEQSTFLGKVSTLSAKEVN